MEFDFRTFYTWYQDNIYDPRHFGIDDKVYAWKVEKNSDWKKYNQKGKQEPFLVVQKNSTIRRMLQVSEKYIEQYKHGMYVITDYIPDWIIFVYPTEKTDVNHKPYPGLFADHFSLPYNPKGKVNQFHCTEYIPNKAITNIDGAYGSRIDTGEKAWFKNNTPIPKTGYDGNFMSMFLSPVRESIIDMLRLPWEQGGGGKRTLSSKQGPSKRPRTSSELLVEKWSQYQINDVFLFAIKINDTYYVTASVYTDKKKTPSEERMGFAFKMKKLDTRSVLKSVEKYIESL